MRKFQRKLKMTSFSFFMAEKQEIVKELKPPKKILNDFKGNEMEVPLFKEVTSSSQFKGAFTFSDQLVLFAKQCVAIQSESLIKELLMCLESQDSLSGMITKNISEELELMVDHLNSTKKN